MRKNKYSACILSISILGLFSIGIANASINTITTTKQITTKQSLHDVKTKNTFTKVANVCFITDTKDCRDNNYSKGDLGDTPGDNTPPPTSPEDEVTQTPCEENGYYKTSCPEGWTAIDLCPYDNNYFKSCECHACDGYEYTADEIPSGYQAGASCDVCGETLYKIIPSDCKGYSSCEHGPADGALICVSGEKTLYSNCCSPLPNETNCPYGTEKASDGCNGTRIICSACKPLPDEEGCENKHLCSDGCAGTRMCCDVDPCANITCGSNAQCQDGKCICNEGYEGNPILGCSKYEEDKCANVTCGANAHCEDGICICNNGYEYNNGQCVAIDKCKNITCGDNAHCENGTCICNDGYEKENGKCVEIDKCRNVTCGANAHCENGKCVCNENYTLLNGYCLPLTNCVDRLCGDNAHCENGACVCDDGYEKENGKCVEIDKCKNVFCGAHAHCEKGECVCDLGFTLIDGKCGLLNACTNVFCGAHAHCENGKCVCDLGYTLIDGKCGLLNACANITCKENEHCEVGKCVCDEGYTKNEKGVCEKICIRKKECYDSTEPCEGSLTRITDGCGGYCQRCSSAECERLGYDKITTNRPCSEWETCPYSVQYKKCIRN